MLLLFKTLFFNMFVTIALCYSGKVYAQKNLPLVTVVGNKFMDANGRTLVLRGLNTSDPDKLEKQGHWNAAYFDEMKAWGAEVVRFPVHPTAWKLRGEKAYYKLLDKGIGLAKERGIYVIIDWHSIGNLKSEIFQSDNYNTTKKETFDFWRKISIRYGKNTTVAFFELFNEPTTYFGQLGICSWPEWKSINEEIITIIRAHQSTAIPLVAGFDWAYDLKEIKTNPINAYNIGYVSHPYPQKRPQPWENHWEEDWGFASEKYPIILTEVGFCEAGEKGEHIPVISDPSYVDTIMAYCDKKGISFVVWVFDADWSPMLLSNWLYKPTKAGQVWKNKLKK